MKNDLVEKVIDDKLNTLENAITQAKSARDDAPSAMESHSDTTRASQERLVNALESEVDSINEIKKDFEASLTKKRGNIVTLWSYVEISLNEKDLEIIIVPEGLGGNTLENVLLVSDKSPLAQAILGKTSDSKFKFNNQSGIVKLVS